MTRRQFAALPGAAFAGRAPNPAIVKAMDAVKAAIPAAEADPARPCYHFRPPAQWSNDPNGTVYYRGWYHLFYQHNPFEAKWGHMHWGHARSRDLIHWEHLPIALWPSLEKGEEHVFSGAAIDGPDGRPLLFYTSIGKRDPEQWLAVPQDDDLLVWEKYPANPVLEMNHHGTMKVHDWRDPFLFSEAGRTFIVTGGNLDPRGGFGSVALYEAGDPGLTKWKHVGPIFRHPRKEVRNLECPNLFRLGGKWVLLVSPHRPVEYFVGELDLAARRFVPETEGVLDPGEAYASNILFDGGGRCILWLWGRTPTAGRAWNSVMALPRVLSLGPDGHLRQSPVPELAALREAETALPVAGDSLEIEAAFDESRARVMGLRVRCSADGRRGIDIAYTPSDGMLRVGERQAWIGRQVPLRLRVFVDKAVTEVYANDGAAAIYAAPATAPADIGVEVFAREGAAKPASLRAWRMRPARFSLEHYRPAL